MQWCTGSVVGISNYLVLAIFVARLGSSWKLLFYFVNLTGSLLDPFMLNCLLSFKFLRNRRSCTGTPFFFLSFFFRQKNDLGRTRTSNLYLRRVARYPLLAAVELSPRDLWSWNIPWKVTFHPNTRLKKSTKFGENGINYIIVSYNRSRNQTQKDHRYHVDIITSWQARK